MTSIHHHDNLSIGKWVQHQKATELGTFCAGIGVNHRQLTVFVNCASDRTLKELWAKLICSTHKLAGRNAEVVKKPLIIAVAFVLLFIGVGIAVFPKGASLQSGARRDWKTRSIAEISARAADPAWPSNELARLKTLGATEAGSDESWLSDHMILMKNGDWLAYASICRKQDRRIHDLFLTRGSDGQWYYSTYHFCIEMVALRMEEQPEDLAGFAKTYFLRTFDGQSDECLQKTWPPDSR